MKAPLAACVLAVCVLVGAAAAPLHAQTTLTTQQKLELLQAAVTSAQERVQKNTTETDKAKQQENLNEAKFYMLGGLILFERAQRQCPADLAQQFAALADQLWPGQVTMDNVVQLATAYQPVIAKYTPLLAEYSGEMDFLTPHDDWSFDRWATYVIRARLIYPDARKCALEYAGQTASPVLQVGDIGDRLGSFPLLGYIFNIMVGDTLANDRAQNDVLPRALQKAQEKLAEATPSVEDPFSLTLIAQEAQELLGYARAIDPRNEQANALEAQAKAVLDRAQRIYAAQVASNRMPSEKYTGDDAAELRGKMTALYQAKYPEDKLQKLLITDSDWVERAEAWWEGDTLESGIFRYLGATVAVQSPDGKYRVFHVTFAREWTGHGDIFGDISLSSIGGGYEILPQNI